MCHCVLGRTMWVSPPHRQNCQLSFLLLPHFSPFYIFLYSIWHSTLCMVGVDTHSPQQGALLLVGGRVQGGQDEGLRGLQGIFEGIQRRYENRGPFPLSTAGAAVSVFGGQAGEARDGVEVGLMGAESGEGAERRQHGKPRRRSQGAADQWHFNFCFKTFFQVDL